ncbi:MAG TPA: hypothetical protein VME17_20690, partial [Bryobacteraceae bacterium]|nr:hypothetical protein [Bryobacteraceae bacterium]
AGQASGDAAALNAASGAFDAQWSTDLASLKTEFPGIVLVGVDIETLFNNILGNPSQYGLNPGATPPGGDPDNYLFTFDGLHPTTAGDALIADLALTDFEAATMPSGSTVPEPTSTALALLGFSGLFVVIQKSKAKNRC